MPALAAGDLTLVKCATPALTLSTSSVGGAKTGTAIDGSTIGQVHFSMPSALLGGGTTTQYNKFFYKNGHSTDDLVDAFIWMPNAFDQPGPAGDTTMTFASSSASDDADYEVWTLGYDPAGDPVLTQKALNGTSNATTSQQFSARHRFEARDATTGDYAALNGNVSLTADATLIGYIPAGYYSATGEIAIWLAASLDDSGTTTNATTAPGGSSFTRPRTFAGGLAVAGDDLLATAGQGIWSRWQLPERAKPSADCQVVTAIQGSI